MIGYYYLSLDHLHILGYKNSAFYISIIANTWFSVLNCVKRSWVARIIITIHSLQVFPRSEHV